MLITEAKTIKDIQAEFHEKFPYLKIEFYDGRHESGKPSPAIKRFDPDLPLRQVRTVHAEGDLSIDGQLQVSTLEDRFWEQFGLNVQVFRLSGNLWLQTSSTDQWTLAEQNRKGGHSLAAFREMHGGEA